MKILPALVTCYKLLIYMGNESYKGVFADKYSCFSLDIKG